MTLPVFVRLIFSTRSAFVKATIISVSFPAALIFADPYQQSYRLFKNLAFRNS